MTDPLVAQLADRMCCVQSHVSMLESERTSPTVATVRRWSEALGLRVALVPETAPVETFNSAGHGAPGQVKGPVDDGAPASRPADAGSGEGRADVAHSDPHLNRLGWCICGCNECGRAFCGCLDCVCDGEEDGGLHVPDEDLVAVARILDVAERTVEKARERRRPMTEAEVQAFCAEEDDLDRIYREKYSAPPATPMPVERGQGSAAPPG